MYLGSVPCVFIILDCYVSCLLYMILAYISIILTQILEKHIKLELPIGKVMLQNNTHYETHTVSQF